MGVGGGTAISADWNNGTITVNIAYIYASDGIATLTISVNNYG